MSTITATKSIIIQRVEPTNSQRLNDCHELLQDVFHQELNLYGMTIPDAYEPFSIYLAMMEGETLVGTCRLVMPNPANRFPIREINFDIEQFPPNSFCEWSRLALIKGYRGRIHFRRFVNAVTQVAKEHHLSTIIAEILPKNLPIFKKYGFYPIGGPLLDPTVESDDPADALVIPIMMRL